MKRQLSFPALVLAFTIFWGGCTTFAPTDRATLNLVGIQSANATVFETAITLALRVTNETSQPLQLQGSSHALRLNGRMIGRGVSNGLIEVPPLGTAVFPVTLRLDNLKLLNEFNGGVMPPEIAYRLESRLFTGAGQRRGLAVLTEGTLDLRPYTTGLRLN